MDDIGLGKALGLLFIILFIIPGVVGFFIGLFGGYHFTKKGTKSPKKALQTGILIAIICAIILPFIIVKLVFFYEGYSRKQREIAKKDFFAQALQNYQIRQTSTINGKYYVSLTVPRTEEYNVLIIGYQNREIVARLPKQKLNLQQGQNTIEIPLEDSYVQNSIPIEFEVEVKSLLKYITYRSPNNKVVKINTREIGVLDVIRYYSPAITEWKDPCQFTNEVPCQPNQKLHITPK